MKRNWVDEFLKAQEKLFSRYSIKLTDIKNMHQHESLIKNGVEITISNGESKWSMRQFIHI